MTKSKTQANILSVQIRPKIGHKQANFEKVKEQIDKNAALFEDGIDLILMPEFFNTGVSAPEFKKLAEEDASSETVAFFSEVAREYNSYVLCGSIIEKSGEKQYNTSRLIDRKGEIIAKYRKIHLFDSFGGTEDQYNTPGDEIVVVDTDFGRVGMSVCFDIKFPKHFLELVKRGAEIIVEPAAWIAPNDILDNATEEWILMNRARALDNFVYFISSNNCGKLDSFMSACGHSMIVGPTGKVLADAGVEDGVAAAQIDLEFLRQFRKNFCMNKLTE